jgi:integrase/recombinase XerC
LVGLFTGIRTSEIAGMEWTRFTGDGWYQVMGKGLKQRLVPVAGELATHFRNIAHDDPRWVFPGSGRQPHVHRSTIWKWVQRVADEAGIGPIAPHRMRHTFGATINDKTGDFRTTQELMGHSDPKTTALYTRATRRRMQDAIDALDYLETGE